MLNIVNNSAHPGRTISSIPNPGGGRPLTLGAFLRGDATRANDVVANFMSGSIELFVQAGDVLGNFSDVQVEIRMIDSCGSQNPSREGQGIIAPSGHPLNPSYFLYIVRSARNSGVVNMLTQFHATPADDPNQIHPLEHILRPPLPIPDTGQELDLEASHPPKPLHVTVTVLNAGGSPIAKKGIPIDALGDWHESRQRTNPYSSAAPVAWRYYGTMASDTVESDYCSFVTQVNPGQASLLPAGINHRHEPQAIHSDRVRAYWERYGSIFNVVAEALEIPCEILVAISCKETATGGWYSTNFATSHEMDTVRLEPLVGTPAALARGNAADQALLTNYQNLAGPPANGTNANMPAPFPIATRVNAGIPLTWTQLADLIRRYPGNVRITPGLMQVQPVVALAGLNLISEIYGLDYVSSIHISHNGVDIVADAPSLRVDQLFSDWFGVAVDAIGNNTNGPAVDTGLTQMKRAMHEIIAGAAHLKRHHNTVRGHGNGQFSFVTDYDLPTMGSAHNDGANLLAAATSGDNDDKKWLRLFAMVYNSSGYPRDLPRYFNATVSYFNGSNFNDITGPPYPTLRLWKR